MRPSSQAGVLGGCDVEKGLQCLPIMQVRLLPTRKGRCWSQGPVRRRLILVGVGQVGWLRVGALGQHIQDGVGLVFQLQATRATPTPRERKEERPIEEALAQR